MGNGSESYLVVPIQLYVSTYKVYGICAADAIGERKKKKKQITLGSLAWFRYHILHSDAFVVTF